MKYIVINQPQYQIYCFFLFAAVFFLNNACMSAVSPADGGPQVYAACPALISRHLFPTGDTENTLCDSVWIWVSVNLDPQGI